MNSSVAKTSCCSWIYNLWTEKEQKLSSLRYLISRKLCHTVEKPGHPESRNERGFTVVFSLMWYPEEPKGSGCHILEEQLQYQNNIYNLFRQYKKKSPNWPDIGGTKHLYIFISSCFLQCISVTCCCRIRNTQRTASNSEAKRTDSPFKKAFPKATQSNL